MADEALPFAVLDAPEVPRSTDALPFALIDGSEKSSSKEQVMGPAPPTHMERFWHGVMDPLNAGAQMLNHAVPDKWTDTVRDAMSSWIPKDFVPSAAQMDKNISDTETAYQAHRSAEDKQGVDWWRLAGNIGGTAPVMAALPFAAPESLSGAVASGAGTGALTGLMEPVTDGGDGFAGKKLGQAGTGALTGALFSPATFGMSRLLSPKPSADIAMLQSKGVAPTLGQIAGGWGDSLEQKLTSWIPGFGDLIKGARGRAVEDFNKAIYNDALAPIGESFNKNAGEEAAVGHEGVKQVGDKLSSAYDDLLPKLTFKADPTFTTELASAKGMIPYAPPEIQTKLSKIIENEVDTRLAPNGIMDGQEYKRMESELSKQIGKYSGDASADVRDMASALKTVLASARDNLERSNPDQAATLKSINRGWAILARTEKAAASTGAKEGVFSPAQFMGAVKWGDNSVRDRATARGEAFMQSLAEAGKSVLGNTVPDSGTAGRLIAGGVLGGLIGGGGAEMAGHIAEHPIATAGAGALAGLAALPYTTPGQRAVSALFSQRSGKILPGLAAAVERAGPALQTGTIYSLTGGGQ